MSDKIDKLLENLNADEVDTLFERILQVKENKLSQSEEKGKPTKRLRNCSELQEMEETSSEQNEWLQVDRGRRNRRKEINLPSNDNPFQGIPGFPVTMNNVPPTIIKNSVVVRNAIKQACPDAKIKSQRSLPEYNRIVYYPVDLKSSEQLLEANFEGTPLEGVTTEKDSKSQNQLSVLITGVDPCIPDSDIVEELNNQGIKIKALNRMKVPGTHNPTFKVKVDLIDPRQKEQIIAKGVYIGYTRNRVLDFKPLPNVLICFNCQEFGHHARGCEKTPICVRCGDEHKVTDCTREEPVCCHCYGFHSGAYRGCPIYKVKQKELATERESSKKVVKQPAQRVPLQEPTPKDPKYEKIVNVLTEVIFLAFDKYVPDPERNNSSFLSDLCLYTTEAMNHHTKQKCDGPDTFTACKTRLREIGFFRPLQSSQSGMDTLEETSLDGS